MTASSIISLMKRLLPGALYVKLKRRFFRLQAKGLQRKLSKLAGLSEKVDFALANYYFPTQQMRNEILSLLEVVQALPARRMLEIGVMGGGTLALFAQACADDARILSLDLSYPDHRLSSHPYLARAGQQIHCVQADTHSPATVGLVDEWLSGSRLDILFIDGDHSYEGVKSDYEMYSRFVRPGGLIVFHDIQQDHLARYGRPSGNFTGGVPAFWLELKSVDLSAIEFIQDAEQDAYGIGLIRVPL